MQDIIERHDLIALQLSGGRDSIACLYLLKPYWDRLTVYWLDTGAAFPETVSLMQQVRDKPPTPAAPVLPPLGEVAQRALAGLVFFLPFSPRRRGSRPFH